MSERTIWVSIRRQKRHEMWRTIRILHPHLKGWQQLVVRLAEIQEKSTQTLIKLVAPLFVIHLAFQAIDEAGKISFSAGGYTASFDPLVVAMLAGAFLFLIGLELQKWATLQGLRNEIGNRIRIPGFSAQTYLFLQGHEEQLPAIPILPYSFLKERGPFSAIASNLMIAILIGLLVPLGYIAATLAQLGFTNFQSAAPFTLDWLKSALLIFILISTPLFLLLMNIPIPMTKNKSAIRWGFLFPFGVYVQHPRALDWIEDEGI